MKLHRPLYRGALECLRLIFNDDQWADKVVQQKLKSEKKWGARDRRQVAEVVYECVRWWRRLAFETGIEWPAPEPLPEKSLAVILDHFLTQDDFAHPNDLPIDIQESYPEDLFEFCQQELKKDWLQLASKLNRQAYIYLRVNHLKTSIENAEASLKELGVETERMMGSTLRLPVRKNVFVTEAFKKGFFEVQDYGSQQIAPFLDVSPGQRVIDACAGAGGKSLHLADLMENKGKIVAFDIHHWKLDELKKRARRAGVSNLETKVINTPKDVKKLKAIDRLLLDVPCSGLGVLRRNPDRKWKFNFDELERLLQIQRDILTQYTQVLSTGGKFVYATCSILPNENQDQVRWFLENHDGWELEDEKTLWPDELDSDGFYMARLRKL